MAIQLPPRAKRSSSFQPLSLPRRVIVPDADRAQPLTFEVPPWISREGSKAEEGRSDESSSVVVEGLNSTPDVDDFYTGAASSTQQPARHVYFNQTGFLVWHSSTNPTVFAASDIIFSRQIVDLSVLQSIAGWPGVGGSLYFDVRGRMQLWSSHGLVASAGDEVFGFKAQLGIDAFGMRIWEQGVSTMPSWSCSETGCPKLLPPSA